MSRHFQVESNLSLSGSNADVRIIAKPSEQKKLLENLFNTLKGTASVDNRLATIVSELIESSVENVLGKGYRTKDIMQSGKNLVTTSDMGSLISEEIKNLSSSFLNDI